MLTLTPNGYIILITGTTNATESYKMSFYKSAITETGDNQFYVLIVRVDTDGEESVIHGYKGRYMKSRAAAEKSTDNYINKWELNVRG